MSLLQSDNVRRALKPRGVRAYSNREFFVRAVAVFWVLFWLLVFLRGVAAAEPNEDRLTLGQAMVAEADFERPIDHAALGWVLKRRWLSQGPTAEPESFSAYVRRYVSIFKAHVKSPRANWVRELNLDATEPASWPENLSWDVYRPKWLAVLDRAQGVMDGTLEDPCRASQWGSRTLPADVIRAERALKSGRWIPARCAGATANRFFRELK